MRAASFTRMHATKWLLPAAWLLLPSGCDKPIPAVPTAATATSGLSICWREKDEADTHRLHDALTTRLRGAGYALLTSRCDLQLDLAYTTRSVQGDDAYRSATMVVRDNTDSLVDKISLEFGPSDVPTEEPDRLAILLVNALNASRKVALLAKGQGSAATPSAPTSHPTQAPPAPSMVQFPGGTFLMGSADGTGTRDERPQHSVTVAAFEMDNTEVTAAAYAKCVQAGKCTAAQTTVDWAGITDSDRDSLSQFCNGGRADRQTHPMNCVDYPQATAYCSWAGKRLPTEDEWEYAARGTEDRSYPWGEAAPDETKVNACGSECAAMAQRLLGKRWSSMYSGSDGWEATAPVGSYPAGRTPQGLFDMAGNVWEWTTTKYFRYGTTETGTGGFVARGGCWDSFMATSVRAANRISDEPAARRNVLGFRCAR